MHVLMVTPRYLPDMGGVEMHVYQVGRRLAGDGYRIEVLTTDRSGSRPSEETADGMLIRRVRAWPPEKDYYWAPAIRREVIASPADVVHIQGYHTFVAPLAMSGAIRVKRPFVVTFHSGGHSSRLRTLLRTPHWAALRPLVRRAAHCIGVSRFEAEFFSRQLHIPRERFSVIPNGAEMPQVSDTSPFTHGPFLVSIGRLERYKGHHRIIEAMPALMAHLPDVKLRVLGEGPYKAQLQALVERLKLQEVVTIGGVTPTDRSGVANILGRASLVVLLSDYEAHPVAVMEALALGRRVLVTEGSGFTEMIEAGMVRSVPARATSSVIADAVFHELQQPDPEPIALPTWDGCAERLKDVYQRVVHSSGRG